MARSEFGNSVATAVLIIAGSLCTLGSGAMAASAIPTDFSTASYSHTVQFSLFPSELGTQYELNVFDDLTTDLSDPSLKIDPGAPETDGLVAFGPTSHEVTIGASSVNLVGSFLDASGYFSSNSESAYLNSDTSSLRPILGVVTGIPLPAIAWLFGSAIMGLSVIARRRHFVSAAGSDSGLSQATLH